MFDIEVGKPGGEQLAKVLIYYGLIPDAADDEYKIVCPFHNDLNPSMKINLVEGTFFCFGCTASGDAMTFVKMANENMTELQACIEYFRILHSDKVRKLSIAARNPKKRGTDLDKWNVAHDYYYCLRTVDWFKDAEQEVIECRDYMKKRGFSRETLKLCHAKVTYNRQYPIIFPMLDNGTFKGWVCRTDKKEVEKRRKYLYNEGFSRATTLVGDYEKSKVVIIVEGYMDRLKFIQFGYKYVVAILGWKITAEQISKLKKAGIVHVVSALDNDTCGKKGTEYLRKFFKVTRFKFEDGCKDAGELTQKSYELAMMLTKKQYLIDAKGGASART